MGTDRNIIFAPVRLRNLLLSLMVGLSVSGCLDEPDCFKLNNNRVALTFVTMDLQPDTSVPIVGITTPNSDSVFYPYTIVNSSLILPLNPATRTETFDFNGVYQQGTLSFSYDREVQYVSEECGSRFLFSNLTLAATGFDSVRVVASLPFAAGEEGYTNVIIQRCPRTNYARLDFKQLRNSIVIADTITPIAVYSSADDPIYLTAASITTLQVPLDKTSDETLIEFDLGSEVKSIRLTYDRISKTLYKVCGTSVLMTNVKVAETNFSSTVLKNDSIQDPPKVNFEIYQ